jgi:hypothetical protein
LPADKRRQKLCRYASWENGMVWKVYFLFFLLLILSNFYHYYTHGIHWWHAIYVLIDILWIMGLYGYSFKKQIFTQRKWRVIFPLTCLLWYAVGYFIPPEGYEMFSHVEEAGTVGLVAVGLIGLIFVGPCILGLSLYSFRAQHIWRVSES